MGPQLATDSHEDALEPSGPGLLATPDAHVRQALNACLAMRRSEDPDHIMDLLVSTALLLAPVSSAWAGWKCGGAPLSHVTVFDPTAPAGPPGTGVAEQLESALEDWGPRLAPGQPPFEVEGPGRVGVDSGCAQHALTVFPMSAGSRIGALVLGARLSQLLGQHALLGLLCDRALAALELTAARQAGQRAEALAETLTQLAASYSDPELVLQTIVRSAARLLRADAAYVMLLDAEQNTLRVRTAHGITGGAFYEASYPVDALLPGVAIRRRRVVCVRDVQSHAETQQSRSEGLRTTMCAPMFVEDQLVGVLVAAHRAVREIRSEDRRAMMALADAAAVSIVNARLYGEREQSICELADLNRVLGERSTAGERTIAFQQRLTALVLEGGGLEEIVRVMSDTLACEVLILDPELAILHASDGAQPDLEHMREAIASLGDAHGIARLPAGESHLLVAPLDLAGTRSAYVAVRHDDVLQGTDRAMMTEAAVTAIGLELMRDRASAEAEARLTGGLFATLLSDENVDEPTLLRRASYLGYDLAGANAVIAVTAEDQAPARLPLSLETCVQRAVRRRRETPIAVFERDDVIFVVLSGPDDVPAGLIKDYAAAIKQELDVSGRSAGTRIAHSGPHLGIAGVRLAVQEARYALHVLGVLGRNGKPHAFEDLGVWTLLGRVGDPGQLMSFADGVLGVLMAHDAERQAQLVDTVRTLVECNFHYRTAAELLFTHPNTLRYRMSRINELTNLDFTNADDRLKVEIALRILDVIGAAKG
jgi:sugar diacid utilization regulator